MKRIILLIILTIEGIGGIFGGSRLVIAPDGSLLKMPVEILHGVFPNFFIPGVILTGMGLLCLIAFVSVLRKSSLSWILTGIALVGFSIWFITEIIILRELHWLHVVWGTPVLVGIWLSLPLIPENRLTIKFKSKGGE